MKIFNIIILLCYFSGAANAQQEALADLPPSAQVEAALRGHVSVMTAEQEIGIAQSERRRWDGGTYEFNLRAGTAQRETAATGQLQREWDVAIERPLRLPNKVFIDGDIGSESVQRASYALGDARHEAARLLLHLWFNWQREQTQVLLWRQQLEILQQQAKLTEKRMRAGDAPRMELNQTQAVAAQAGVSLQQAETRAQLAASELKRPFPELQLPAAPLLATPQPIEQELAYWQDRIVADNHELELMQAENRVQQLLAQRLRADRVPDPTVGLRYSSEKAGEEKVAGVYMSVPLSFGLRSAHAEVAQRQADIAQARELATRRRLDGDIYAAYTLAKNNFSVWQQAQAAAQSVRENAALITRAYSLGESSITDVLQARRLALESGLAENMALLDANEARYRLLLDAHLLWAMQSH